MMQLQKDAPTLTDKQSKLEQSLMQQQANFKRTSLQQERARAGSNSFQKNANLPLKNWQKKVMIWFLIHYNAYYKPGFDLSHEVISLMKKKSNLYYLLILNALIFNGMGAFLFWFRWPCFSLKHFRKIKFRLSVTR